MLSIPDPLRPAEIAKNKRSRRSHKFRAKNNRCTDFWDVCYCWLYMPMYLPPSDPRRRNIPTLDGWRAIAILLVLAHHARAGFYATESDYYAQSITRFGAFGVDIFF